MSISTQGSQHLVPCPSPLQGCAQHLPTGLGCGPGEQGPILTVGVLPLCFHLPVLSIISVGKAQQFQSQSVTPETVPPLSISSWSNLGLPSQTARMEQPHSLTNSQLQPLKALAHLELKSASAWLTPRVTVPFWTQRSGCTLCSRTAPWRLSIGALR